MLKTIIKIILAILILAVIGVGIYIFFDRQQKTADPNDTSGLSIGDFFPFGNSDTTGDNTNQTPPNNTVQNNPINTDVPTAPPRLWQISTQPQSGSVVWIATGTPMVRYVDKATGNVFESSLRLIGQKRVTNTTIPKVYEAKWQSSGKALLFRFLGTNQETIRTTFGRITTSSIPASGSDNAGLQEIQATFLPDNISSLAMNQTNGNLVYAQVYPSGASVQTANATGATVKNIWSGTLKDILVGWVNPTTVSITTKASADAVGSLYFVKTDTNKVERVLGGRGLTALPNGLGSFVFYSESAGSGLLSRIFNTKTGDTMELSFATLAEKCVWSPKNLVVYCAVPENLSSGKYPDAWYQGKVSFNDVFWQFDTTSGVGRFLADPEQAVGKQIDAVNLSLDPNEEYLVFTNKKDSQLWGLKIKTN